MQTIEASSSSHKSTLPKSSKISVNEPSTKISGGSEGARPGSLLRVLMKSESPQTDDLNQLIDTYSPLLERPTRSQPSEPKFLLVKVSQPKEILSRKFYLCRKTTTNPFLSNVQCKQDPVKDVQTSSSHKVSFNGNSNPVLSNLLFTQEEIKAISLTAHAPCKSKESDRKEITINSLLESRPVVNKALGLMQAKSSRIKNPTGELPGSVKLSNVSKIGQEITEFFLSQQLPPPSESAPDKLCLESERILLSPELSPVHSKHPESIPNPTLCLSSISETVDISIPILPIASEIGDIVDNVPESLISESIEQIEDYIESGGSKILQQLTEDGLNFDASVDFDEINSCDNVTACANELNNDSVNNARIRKTRTKKRSRLHRDRLLKKQFALKSKCERKKRKINSGDSNFPISPNQSNSDTISCIETDSTVHSPVSSDFLQNWGKVEGSEKYNDYLSPTMGGAPSRQMVPFRGCGYEPEIDTSISNAPLQGLDHHIVSKIQHNNSPGSKTTMGNLLLTTSKNVDSQTLEPKTCSVTLEHVSCGKDQDLNGKYKSITSMDSSCENGNILSGRLSEVQSQHSQPDSNQDNLNQKDNTAIPIVESTEESGTALYNSTKKLVDEAIKNLVSKHDVRMKMYNARAVSKNQKVVKQKAYRSIAPENNYNMTLQKQPVGLSIKETLSCQATSTTTLKPHKTYPKTKGRYIVCDHKSSKQDLEIFTPLNSKGTVSVPPTGINLQRTELSDQHSRKVTNDDKQYNWQNRGKIMTSNSSIILKSSDGIRITPTNDPMTIYKELDDILDLFPEDDDLMSWGISSNGTITEKGRSRTSK